MFTIRMSTHVAPAGVYQQQWQQPMHVQLLLLLLSSPKWEKTCLPSKQLSQHQSLCAKMCFFCVLQGGAAASFAARAMDSRALQCHDQLDLDVAPAPLARTSTLLALNGDRL